MLALAIFSAYQLFRPSEDYSNSKASVAEIISQVNTVKTKRSNWLAWIDSAIGIKLSDQDMVYTHSESSADLELLDGSQISLAENTLFKVTGNENNESLTLEQGIVFAKLSKSRSDLKLSIGDKELKLSANEAEFQVSKDSETENIALLSGEMKIQNESGIQVLKEDQQAILSGNTISVINIPVNKLIPNKEKIYSIDKWDIRFQWNIKSDCEELKLEISKDRTFKNKRSIQVANNLETVETFDQEGLYYWRIVGVANDQSFKTPLRTFTLKRELAPDIFSPLENSKIVTFSPKLKKLQILWTKLDFKQYEVHITQAGDTKTQKVLGHSYSLENLFPGGYSVKIKGDDSNRPLALWSKEVNFEIVHVEKLLEPILNAPTNGTEKVIYSNEADIHFSWAEVIGAEKYLLEIQTSSELLQIQTFQNHAKVSFKETGNFKWKVRAMTDLQESISSEATFILTLAQDMQLEPENGALIELKRPDQEVTFTWDSQDQKSQAYLLEISDQNNFDNIIVSRKERNTSTSITFSKTGKYYWRTRILSEDGKAIYSRPVQIEVVPAPPPTPLQLPDFKEIEIKIEKSSTSILDFFISRAHASEAYADIDWPKNEDAKSYLLEIYQDPDMKVKVLSENIDKNSFKWTNPTEGTFYWRVAIIDFWGRQNQFSNLSKLILTYPNQFFKPNEVELDLPKHRSRITQKTKFSWEKDSKAEGYEFLIAADLDFNNIILREKLKSNSIEIDPVKEKIKPNQRIFWKVIAIGKNNQTNSSLRRQFTFVKDEAPAIAENKASKITNKNQSITKIQQAPEKYWVLEILPSKFNQESTTTRTTTVDGTAINSVRFSYFTKSPIRFADSTLFEISRVSGEVFNALAFSQIQARFQGLKKYSFSNVSFDLMAGLSVINKTSHPYTTQVTEESNALITIPVGVSKRFVMTDQIQFNAQISALFGQLMGIELRGHGLYFLNSERFLKGGLDITSGSYDSTSSEVSFSQTSLVFGYGQTF